jgi:hypothetical protein
LIGWRGDDENLILNTWMDDVSAEIDKKRNQSRGMFIFLSLKHHIEFQVRTFSSVGHGTLK